MTNLILILLLAAAISVLLLTMYIYLLWRKLLTQVLARKKASWLKQNSHDIEIYLTTGWGIDLFTILEDYQFEVLEDKLSDYLSNFKIEADFNPIQRIVDQYLVPRYRERLKHRRWSTRMNTLYFIDMFKIEAMQGDLVEHLNSKQCSSEERYEIFLMLAVFEHKDLMRLLQGSKEMPSFLLTELMSRFVHQDNVDHYVNVFFQFQPSWQGAILDVVRVKNLRTEQLQRLLEELIVSDYRELHIRALKAIAALGYITSIDPIVSRLDNLIASNQWDNPQMSGEKLMSARLMGSIRHEEFMPFLLRLVGDKVYNVRSEAAKAIRQYKNGMSILQSIALTHSDAYARSISQEWMERSLDFE